MTKKKKLQTPYIIAEVASTHEGDIDYLIKLISEISGIGADAIKFQIYLAEEIVEKGHTDYQDLLSCQFAEKEWKKVIEFSAELQLDVWVELSGGYGQKIIEQNYGVIKGVKLHASNTQNPIVIDYINKSKLDLIISCGGTTLVEIFSLLNELDLNDMEIILMHGFQSYPTDINDCHIDRIRTLCKMFPYKIGYGDHISGDSIAAKWLPLVALGAGASVFEKHITLDREEKRDDYYSSLEPGEFKEMVNVLRKSADACGEEKYDFPEDEVRYRSKMKRIAVATTSKSKGTILEIDDVNLIVPEIPGNIPTVEKILKLPLKRDIKNDDIIKHDDLQAKIVVFVNARLASSRLPGKALLPFYEDFCTIEYLLTRLKHYPTLPGRIVFATTTEKEDDPLIKCAEKVGVDYYRGANLDVMKRMLQVADCFGFDTLVRVTGDDILISGEYIEKLVAFHFENNLEYSRIEGLPVGMECEVIDIDTLALIHKYVVDKDMTEQLTWYLDYDGICKNGVLKVMAGQRLDRYRLTLDYQEDLDLMKTIVSELHPKTKDFYIDTEDLLGWLQKNNPQWQNQPHLWPYERHEVNTDLKYIPMHSE